MTIRIWSPEARVNVATFGAQNDARVTRLADGGFVVVWTDAAQNGDIYARLYNAAGLPTSGDLAISTGADADGTPRVAALGNGGFRVFWERGALYAHREFSAAGVGVSGIATISNAFSLNAVGQGAQQGFVLTYADSGSGDILVNRHDNIGNFTNFTVVNNTTAGIQADPDIATLADGRLVVVWRTDFVDIRARILTSTAGVSTPATDFIVNTTSFTSSDGTRPTVTGLRDGGFVVTWDTQASSPLGNMFDIRGRAYLPNGSAAGDDFLINSTLAAAQFFPDVVALPNGGFLVVWEDRATNSIKAQAYDLFGARIGAEAQVSTGGSNAFDPSATVLADGRVAVTWHTSAAGLGDTTSSVRMTIIDPRDGLVFGGNGADTLFGGEYDDQITAQSGNDTVFAQGGDDRVFAGLGNDLVFGFLGSDNLYGFDGDDLLNGGTGDDQLLGEFGADTLIGELGDDLMFGGDGNDTMNGSAGQDTLYGQNGDDVMLGENGDDAFFGGFGADQILGGRGEDVLSGEEGGDTLLGEIGDDLLEGGVGGDVLDGGDGVDNLMGGADGDVLIGGPGGDRLEGGAGGDIYWWRAPAEGNDLVVGFVSADDQLQFTGSAFGFAAGASLTLGTSFVLGTGPTAATPTFYYNGGALFFDPDGTGGQGAVFIALLQGAPALTAGDFQFV